jgi:hypothetical protein
MIFPLLIMLPCVPVLSRAQAVSQPPTAAAGERQISLQWTEMKGKRTQIFIDLNAKGQSTYHGINSDFEPTLMVQLPGDGSVDLLEYKGSGDDWNWVPVHAHIKLTHPAAGVDRVDFDYAPLQPSHKLTVMFRSLNDAWEPVASSKALPWKPS